MNTCSPLRGGDWFLDVVHIEHARKCVCKYHEAERGIVLGRRLEGEFMPVAI